MMRALIVLMLLLSAEPADAGCFLFFCPSRHHPHHHHFHHHHRHARVGKVKIILKEKKVVVIHERKAHAMVIDRTPISPLK